MDLKITHIYQKDSLIAAQGIFMIETDFVRLGRIQYMNVAPVYYHLNKDNQPDIQLTIAPPSMLNQMLAQDQLDISPVSSVAYARHQHQWLLLPNLSISCFGSVMSVRLVSRYPLYDLSQRNIILSSESETGADLLKLILADKEVTAHFRQKSIPSPQWIDQQDDAALLIGDIALKYSWESLFPYVYDLGDLWTSLTGLPFVFGVWAVRKQYAIKHFDRVQQMVKKFYHSKKQGLEHLDGISKMAAQKLGLEVSICRKYYTKLNYDLNEKHIKGMSLFFSGLYEKKIIHHPVDIQFI